MTTEAGPAAPAEEVDAARAALAAGDSDAVVAHLSAAIRGFTTAGQPRDAAMACVELGFVFAYVLGNLTASRAWYTRAERLVADEPPCIEQGWVAVAAMGCDVDDPTDLMERAELALDRARTFGDLNLEAKALADGGLARVRLGRVDEGMGLLDEAMALVCGPADDVETATKSACSFFTACYNSADYRRAGVWDQALTDQGVMAPTPGGRAFLRSHCSSVRAALLCELGRWSEAERIYLDAAIEFEHIMGAPAWHPVMGLADLRVRQGRFTEAEQLLLGRDAWLEALLPAARLHLARGEFDLASAEARRGLRAVGTDRVRAAELQAILVEASIGAGDLAAAEAAATEMEQLVTEVDVPAVAARSRLARARLTAAGGAIEVAAGQLRDAVDVLGDADATWLRSSMLIELSDFLDRAGDRAGALVELRLALGALTGLDVVLTDAQAAVVARLEGAESRAVTPGSPSPMASSMTALLATRPGGGWQAEHGAVRVPLNRSKGLAYLAHLLQRPGVEQHALDLVDRVEGVGEVDRRALGDAGPLLDGGARAAYRRRIEELRAEVDDAVAIGALERAEQLQDELDQLVAQLAAAFGLGGRDRIAASAAERARLNVTRAIRTAVTRLAEALPDAGASLDRGIRTGTYCVYEPTDDDIVWVTRSESFSRE